MTANGDPEDPSKAPEGAPEDEFNEDVPTNALRDEFLDEPTRSERPPVEGQLPGDLPPEELEGLPDVPGADADAAFDASDEAAGPLSGPSADEGESEEEGEGEDEGESGADGEADEGGERDDEADEGGERDDDGLSPLEPEGPTSVTAEELLPHVNDAPPPSEDAPAGDEGEGQGGSARLESILESLLFAADKPLALKQLGELVGENDLVKVREAVSAVETYYQPRGIQLHQVAGGYQFRTSPENASWVQKLLQQKPVRLSRALLETLAIVAYRQPITRPEIDEIRGVDSGGTLKTLMDRVLVRILGKKEEPGRPMLYGTTREFLEFFNLRDLKDLPTLREFHELTEEHRAQVAALEGVAPEGAVETEEEARVAAEAATRPLERVDLKAPPEDAAELEEIDRLIATAGANLPAGDPTAPPGAPPGEHDAFEGGGESEAEG